MANCNSCINGKLPSYSATCVECGLSRENFKPITNADRIRAMTDEEMADYLRWHDDLYSRYGMDWLDWLKQEPKEGE